MCACVPVCLQYQTCALEDAARRVQAGQPPSDEVAREWELDRGRAERRETEELQSVARAEQEELRRLPDGSLTQAEPRPNAYIPDDDALPLPRPYGAHAPFKPAKQGSSSNMRHFRKPQPKPIEL